MPNYLKKMTRCRWQAPAVSVLSMWLLCATAWGQAAGKAPKLASATATPHAVGGNAVFSEEVLLLDKSQSLHAGLKMWRTQAGHIPVYFVEKTALPIVDIRVLIDAGSARDGRYPGVAYLTAALLSTGAGRYSEEHIATLLDQYGIQYQHHVDRDATMLSLRVLSNKNALQSGLTVLRALLTAPQFPAAPFRRVVRQMRQVHKQALQDPDTQLRMHFYRDLYDHHPYAHAVIGDSEADLKRLTLPIIKRFYHDYYQASNMRVVLVGDISEAQARLLSERLVSGMLQDRPAAPAVVRAVPAMRGAKAVAKNPPNKARVRHYAFPSQQANIRWGQIGISRYHPDYFPFIVGNHILGSPLTSRLFEQVRNKRGLAYSVYSQLGRWKANGAFWIGMQTQHAKTDQAREALHQTLARFLRRGPTHAELEQAKQQMIGNFLIGLSTNAGVAAQATMLASWGLPLNYLDQVPLRLNAVTPKQVKAVFNRQVDMDRMLTVVVGPSP